MLQLLKKETHTTDGANLQGSTLYSRYHSDIPDC